MTKMGELHTLPLRGLERRLRVLEVFFRVTVVGCPTLGTVLFFAGPSVEHLVVTGAWLGMALIARRWVHDLWEESRRRLELTKGANE